MKRGQVTLFIIIGIILLITVGLIIYLAQREAVVERPEFAKVPQQAAPVSDIVSECVRDVATRAIKRLGERGGSLDSSFSYNRFVPTEGEAVEFSEDSGLVIPYWWHMKSPNSCLGNCQFELNIPPLYASQGPKSIESRLTDYISENVRSCINFASLEQQGYRVSELSSPDLKATVTPVDVFVAGKYPLRVEKDGAVTDIEDVYVPLDVNLKEAYDLAVEIAMLEADQQMLEGGTKELIAIFSGTDEDQLPPVADLRLTYDTPRVWIKRDVEQRLQSILSSHLSLIRSGSTRNYNYALSPGKGEYRALYEVIYNRQFFVPLNGSYPDYSFNVVYLPWWNMYFDMNCNGQICTADQSNFPALALFGVQEYQFNYDASYPALVLLQDSKAFDGEGFVFQFFLEANLRNNNPIVDATLLGPSGIQQSILCNPDQFHSGELTVDVVDGTNKLALDDAVVSYRCADSNCVIGKTLDGVLVSKYPKCVDGVLTVSKDGYSSSAGYLSTDFDEGRSVVVELFPRANVTVSASKIVFTKNGKHAPWRRVGDLAASLVDPDEQVVIMLEKEKRNVFDEDYAVVVVLDGPEKKSALLSPGRYVGKIIATKRPDPAVVIPVDRRCEEYPDPFWPFMSETCYNIPDAPIVFDAENPMVSGGASFNATLDVKEGSHVTFQYVSIGLDRVPERLRIAEDLGELGKFDVYSQALRLRPVVT